MSDQEQNIPSPCISVCALNEQDICMGCYRSADEIRQWNQLNNGDKKDVLKTAHERGKAFNPFI